MLLRIQHETKLRYSDSVAETVFEVRMAPQSDEDQTNLGYRLKINPSAPVTSYRDGFGNRVDLFNIMTPYQDLLIQTTTLMRTHRRPGAARLADADLGGDGATTLEALEYLQPSPLVNRCDDLDAFVASLPRPHSGRSLAESVAAAAGSGLRPAEVREEGHHRADPAQRGAGAGPGGLPGLRAPLPGGLPRYRTPARYVSGYLCGPGELATHAWCQVWGGRIGWVDVDPTRGTFADDNYVVTAVGRDFFDVPPNRGVWKGQADEVITVAVKVEPTERMPPDWAEWNAQASWAGTPWTHSQRYDRRHNPFSKSLYRQQQSQQQQWS